MSLVVMGNLDLFDVSQWTPKTGSSTLLLMHLKGYYEQLARCPLLLARPR